MKCTRLFTIFLAIAVSCQSQSWTNHDFELSTAGTYTTSTGVSGWTISSQSFTSCGTNTLWVPGSPEFSVLATPLINEPVIGTIPNSPLGGSKIIRMNDAAAGSLRTKLAKTFTVGSMCTYLNFAYAAVFENGSHPCCEQPTFRVEVRDCQGNLVACPSYTLGGPGCSYIPSFSVTSGKYWSNWREEGMILNAFVGSCFTAEFIVNDCSHGDHSASVYLDTHIGVCTWLDCCMYLPVVPTISYSYCPNSTNALISATPFFSNYYWQSSNSSVSLSQSTLSSITVTNPVPGTSYSLTVVVPSSCIYQNVLTLTPSSVNITAVGASPSCSMGTSGSATVLASGSNLGYSYNWYNTSGLVGTNQVMNNVPPGIYTVQVAAAGSASSTCGLATTTVAVNAAPAFTNMIKPYCAGQSAYFSIFTPGSSFQWYAGGTAITASLGGTSSSLTVASPVNGSVYTVAYSTPLGCRDSIRYTLFSTVPGSMSLLNNALTCAGTQTGSAVISFTPSLGSSIKQYYVVSTGTTPTYSASALSMSDFTVTGLSAPGTYSATTFDGNCVFSTVFTVNTLPRPSFSMSPSSSIAVCSGSNSVAGVLMSSPTSSYNFSWSPSTWLLGGSTTLPNTILTPSTLPGTSATIVYTILVTPKIQDCPSTKTLAVTVSNPFPASISNPGQFCGNAAPVALSGQPPGGYFINASSNQAINGSGLLTPSMAPAGVNNFTYAVALNNCVSMAASQYTILPPPVLSISGSTSICAGQSSTLTGSGAANYQWQGAGQNPVMVVAPAVSTIYTLTGTSSAGCSADLTVTVDVTPVPTIAVIGNHQVCTGSASTLTATGAHSYSWSSGGNSPVQVFAPAVTSNYTVTGINNPAGCTSGTVITINVLPLPVISVTGPDTVCSGVTVVLNAQGGSTYAWNGVPGTNSYTFNASAAMVFTLTGTDQNGCSAKTTHAITLEDCTGLPDLAGAEQVKLYPNPTTGQLYISLPESALVTLHDVSGKLIYSARLDKGQNTIDLSACSAGIYLLEAKVRERSTVVRIIRKD